LCIADALCVAGASCIDAFETKRLSRPLNLSDSDIRALGSGEILVRDDMLPMAEVRAGAMALDVIEASRRLRPAGFGHQGRRDPSLRGDRTTWVGDVDDAALLKLRVFFEDVRLELNSSVWLGLASFTIQLAHFPGAGTRYVKHHDALAGDPTRRATAILYLNPDWVPSDGGCLRVDPPSGQHDLQPLGGRLVVFLSDKVAHEVLPCHTARRAATAWYQRY